MNKLLFLGTIVISLTSPCSNSSQSDNTDNPKVREKAMKNTLKQKKLILSELK
jgi:hypothetical protein